jgi:hypothetical protein
MSATLEELDAWLSEPEAERLELKEARALAKEGGGKSDSRGHRQAA